MFYFFTLNRWSPKKTYGAEPSYLFGSSAIVHEGNMLLFGGGYTIRGDYRRDLHALNLESWRWSKLSPRGTPPPGCIYASTWLHGGKVYFFGGATSNNPPVCTNQLFCYDVPSNRWEWPHVGGKYSM